MEKRKKLAKVVYPSKQKGYSGIYFDSIEGQDKLVISFGDKISQQLFFEIASSLAQLGHLV